MGGVEFKGKLSWWFGDCINKIMVIISKYDSIKMVFYIF